MDAQTLILTTIIGAPSPKVEPLKWFDKIHEKGLISLLNCFKSYHSNFFIESQNNRIGYCSN